MRTNRGWVLVAALMVMGMLSATVWAQKAATPASNKPASNGADNRAAVKPVSEAGTSAAGDADVMAIVDGVVLPMSDLTDILIFSYGLPMAQQLVANELVRQEARRSNVTVGLAEIADEHRTALQQMFPDLRKPAEREQAFHVFMQESGVTQKQWDMTMERNALLRQLAKSRVKVTDEVLQHAFGIKYNRQVVVRHIQTASLTDAESVMKDLKNGVPFEKLVQSRSTNPSRLRDDGLLAPISAQSPGMTPGLREAALNLTKIGQISNVIQAGTTYHILKLEKIIEPDKKFADVKDALRKEVFEEMVQQQQLSILSDLIQRSEEQKKIRYVNPILAELDRQAKTAPQPAKP